jgi:hypothetical protein
LQAILNSDKIFLNDQLANYSNDRVPPLRKRKKKENRRQQGKVYKKLGRCTSVKGEVEFWVSGGNADVAYTNIFNN